MEYVAVFILLLLSIWSVFVLYISHKAIKNGSRNQADALIFFIYAPVMLVASLVFAILEYISTL